MKTLKLSIEIFCFAFLMLFYQTSYCQPQNDQYSVSKYTYLVIQYAKDPVKSGNASAFFVRKNKKLYLVTCYHVFTGLDSWSGNDTGPYDSIRVRYYDNEGRVNFFTIKSPSEGFDFKNFKQDPDIHIYQVTASLPKNATIYSIEKFIAVAEQRKKFDSRQLISYQYSRSQDDMIAQQVKSIMKNNELSLGFSHTLVPNSSLSDKPVFLNVKDQSQNSLPVWNSILNNSFLGGQTLFKKDTALLEPHLNFWNQPDILNSGYKIRLDSGNIPLIQNNLTQWSNQSVFPNIKVSENSPLIINAATFISSPIATDTLPFFTYLNKMETAFAFEKSEPLNLASFSINTEKPVWNNDKSFEKLFSTITSQRHQDTLNIFSNLGEPYYLGKNNYFTDFDSITNTYPNLQGAYKLRNEQENKPVFDVPKFDDSFWDILGKSKAEFNFPFQDTLQFTPVLLQENKFINLNQLNIQTFTSPSFQDIFSQINFVSFPSVYYTTEIIDGGTIGVNDYELYDNYFITMPPSAPGGSGSPLFFLCKGTINSKQVEWIEFAGMQCANINRSSKYLFIQSIQPLATIMLKADIIIQKINSLK